MSETATTESQPAHAAPSTALGGGATALPGTKAPPPRRPQGQYQLDLGHQELDRILEEIDEVCKATPAEWITAQAMGSFLCHTMGYEDINEFEEALNGSFEDFLRALPQLVTKVDDQGRLVLQMKPEPPQDQWVHTRMTYRVENSQDLWNVLLQSPHAAIQLPSMEFEIVADGKRHVDSIYNYITKAVFNLDSYAKTAGGVGMDEDTRGKIAETIVQLNLLLDVPEPFDVVIDDPSGQSEFSDMSRVQIDKPPQ